MRFPPTPGSPCRVCFYAKVVYFEENHSSQQKGMLHIAAEGGTATEGDRGGGEVLGRVTWG